ncbi:UDP-glucose/GDP-mannose dehydrogenase family protein [uncultured Xylophilus sp.]|uniref:UDP-glucose dehydrogenase family protein n=1 Tax=uncultured Xylophilus sp. TaxID=296832 RepID=UPI0025E3EED1|nr:UDP-glucose/GDP-mannose dehydrogenase family protein [uncultured Xylophilus sp.]
MKIAVMGAGYVGLVTAACFADLGVDVACVDTDAAKVARLRKGQIPIYEPGLDLLVQQALANERLHFTDDAAEAIAGRSIVFIAVGTPPAEDGSADLGYVLSAARSIGAAMDDFTVVVDKSTVPVGTADHVGDAIRSALAVRGANPGFAVVSNPEFLKEGAAIADFMRPDRVVLGLPAGPDGQRARALLDELYAPLTRNHHRTLYMDVRSAELTKYAANAMLATRISFMNELANLADAVGADIEAVRQGIGSDSRIGYDFLYAGTGYGGSCFPKDIRALRDTGRQYGVTLDVVAAVEDANARQKTVLTRKIVARLGEDLDGRHFALWGLAFKPNTDDMRDAPSRDIVRALLERGATVTAYDPAAMDEARHAFAHDLADRPALLDRLGYADSADAALAWADALVIVTEWKVFRTPHFGKLRAALRQPLVFDGRNLYAPHRMQAEGIEYHAIGRAADRAG